MRLLRGLRTDFFFSTSLSIFLIRFFPSLAVTLVMILFSRQLPMSEYGTYQQFITQALILNTIACAGIQALVITYPKEFVANLLQRLKRRQYFLFACWVILMSVVFGLLQLSAGFSFSMAICYLLFYSFQVITEAILIAFRKFRILIIINFLFTIVYAALHWLLLGGSITLTGLFIGLTLLSILKTTACLCILVKVQRVYRNKQDHEDLSSVRSLWVHLGIFDVILVLYKWIDKFVLGFILTKELFAIYFNGSVDVPILPVLLGAAGNAILIQLAIKSDEDENKRLLKVLHHSSRLLSCLVFPLFFYLMFFRYELFEVMFTTKYNAAVPIFLVAIMILPVRAYNFTTVLQNKKRGDVINIGGLIDIFLACVLMYPFYQWFGLPGVALAFVVSIYLQGVYYLSVTARLLGVGFFRLIPWSNWFPKIIVFGTVLIIIHYISTMFFVPGIVLLLGGISALSMAVIALAIELKKAKAHGKAIVQE